MGRTESPEIDLPVSGYLAYDCSDIHKERKAHSFNGVGELVIHLEK